METLILGSTVPCAPPPAGEAVDAEARILLDGRVLRVVNVDGRVPRQLASRRSDRARHVYIEGEVAHFEWGGHRYALVPEAAEDEGPDPEPPPDPSQIHHLLTNRELQIVQLVCLGLLTKQIADRLRLSEFTVRSYLKTIYCKLGVRSRGAMVYQYAQALSQCGDQRL